MTPLRPSLTLVHQILREECEGTDVTPAMVMSLDRRKAVSWVRARACKRLRELGRFSYPGIGSVLNIEHSSVLHAVRRKTDGPLPKLQGQRPAQASKRVKFLREMGWA